MSTLKNALSAIIILLVGIVIGSLAGILSNRMTVDTVSLWLDQKSAVEQYDFLDSRLDANMRRMIAEHWCLQNPKTVRVCHNATKYSAPVKTSGAVQLYDGDVVCRRANGCLTTMTPSMLSYASGVSK